MTTSDAVDDWTMTDGWWSVSLTTYCPASLSWTSEMTKQCRRPCSDTDTPSLPPPTICLSSVHLRVTITLSRFMQPHYRPCPSLRLSVCCSSASTLCTGFSLKNKKCSDKPKLVKTLQRAGVMDVLIFS